MYLNFKDKFLVKLNPDRQTVWNSIFFYENGHVLHYNKLRLNVPNYLYRRSVAKKRDAVQIWMVGQSSPTSLNPIEQPQEPNCKTLMMSLLKPAPVRCLPPSSPTLEVTLWKRLCMCVSINAEKCFLWLSRSCDLKSFQLLLLFCRQLCWKGECFHSELAFCTDLTSMKIRIVLDVFLGAIWF